MTALRLSWLGRPVVELDGRPVKLEMRKATALLAYLSLSAHECPRESLAALFWPDCDQRHAFANLRGSLYSLNHTLGSAAASEAETEATDLAPDSGTWLDADREVIGCKRRSQISVDVEEFRRCLGEGDPEHLEAAEAAAALYRGDFLEGLNLPDCPDFDEWQRFEREGLRRDVAGVLAQLAQSYAEQAESQADLERAIAHARRWVALDWLDERAHRVLMDLYARAGQPSMAIRQYAECSRLLRDELVQPPEPETRALYERIRSGKPAPLSVAGPSTSSSASLSRQHAVLPLLATKLRIPPLRASVVPRPRLTSLLDQGVERTLTLLSAPAGFGKTTLLLEWARSTRMPLAWLSLDHGDNDPARFLAYLAAALENVQPGLASAVQSAFASLQPTATAATAATAAAPIMTELINGLTSRVEPFALVLDDYHLITATPVHEMAALLVEHMPPPMHLIIATRADPLLPLVRLRAAGQLMEVRAADLRFTGEEAATFLHPLMGQGLVPENIAALEARTEGWIAGLQMAALSMRGRADLSHFIESFSGSHHYVMDYLLEEVLARQPEEVQSFLLQTCVLERLSGPLCDAVTVRSGSQQKIEYAERANLFLVPLDDERHWYRYHHLFAELLRTRLQEQQPGLASTLHSRASVWYEQRGLIPEAIEHALQAEDLDRAARLLSAHGRDFLLIQGQVHTLLRWFEHIPGDLLRSRPRLSLTKAYGLVYSWQFPAAEEWLEAAAYAAQAGAEAGVVESEESATLLAEIAGLRALGAAMRGDEQTLVEQAALMRAGMGALDPRVRPLASFILGQFYRYQGNARASEEAYGEGERGAVEAGYVDFAAACGACRADRLFEQGRLREAFDTYLYWIRAFREGGRRPPAFVAQCYVRAALLLVEWDDLEAAAEYNAAGVKLTGQVNPPSAVLLSFPVRLKWAQGDVAGALRACEEGLQAARAFQARNNEAEILARQAQLWLAGDDKAAAEAWARRRGLGPRDEVSFMRECEYLVFARVLIATGRGSAALRLLKCMGNVVEEQGRYGSLMEIFGLQALAQDVLGRSRAAVRTLERALLLGEPEGYVRVFVDEGPPMARLLALVPEGHPGRSYAMQLLTRFTPAPAAARKPGRA